VKGGNKHQNKEKENTVTEHFDSPVTINLSFLKYFDPFLKEMYFLSGIKEPERM